MSIWSRWKGKRVASEIHCEAAIVAAQDRHERARDERA